MKERLKLMSFDAEEELRRHKIFWDLIARRWKSLFAVFLLIVICFFADLAFNTWLAPVIIEQPWFSTLSAFFVFPRMDIIVSLLSSVIAGIAAIIGILLAISLVVIQLSAQKYPYRMVRFIIEEKVGAYVLDVLIVSLLFSLWTLFLLQRGANIPFISIIISLILASLSILFAFVYGQYSLYFFRPEQGFRAVAVEANRSLNLFFKKGSKLGRTATAKLRYRVSESINVMTDFIDVLLSREKTKDEDSWFGSISLAAVLTNYISQKRFIETDSGWYKYATLRASDNLYELNSVYEEAALQRTVQKADTEWLERAVLQSLDIVQKKLFKNKEDEKVDLSCLASLATAYSEIIKSCFEYQEFGILDLTMKNIKGLSETLSDDSPNTNDFYNLLVYLAEYSIQGLDLNGLKKVVPTLSWESQSEIISLRLPKIYNDILIEYQQKIETEVIIEGKVVTPKEVIDEEIAKTIESKQDIACKYFSEVFLLLDPLFGKASGNKNVSEIEKILTVELICLRRSIVNNKARLSEAHIDTVMKHCLTGYVLLKQSETRRNVYNEIKLAYLNSVKSKSTISQPKFFDGLAKIVAMESIIFKANSKESFYPEALQGLMVSCSLAYLYSEFYQEKAVFSEIMDILVKDYDVKKLAQNYEVLLTNFAFSGMTLEYHHWFKDVLIEIGHLPVTAEHPEGRRSTVFIRQHKSMFIKNASDLLGIEECTKQVVKELRKRGRKQ
jgi:hypothetical protein